MKEKIKTALKVIKFLISDKEVIKFLISDKKIIMSTIICIISFAVWLYLMIIRHSMLDLFIQPMACYMGYRIARFRWFAFLPGGRWLSDHFYYRVKYGFKSWYNYFRFIKENTFTLDYTYIRREMIKGDPSSKRETTGIGAVTFGFGKSKYIFNLH
jgi:hypothetical protein